MRASTWPETLHGGGDEGVGVGGAGDIGGYGEGVGAGGDGFIPRRRNGAGAAAGDDQAGAGAGQGAGHFQAQAGAAAGDYHHAAVQIQVFQHWVANLLLPVSGCLIGRVSFQTAWSANRFGARARFRLAPE